MAGESVAELLAQATSQTGESAAVIYAKWAGLTLAGDDSLYRLVFRNLTAHGHTANIRENLLSTLQAGGAVGESIGECILKSSLTGWS